MNRGRKFYPDEKTHETMIRSTIVLLCLLTAAPAQAQSLSAAAVRPPKGATLCGERVPLQRHDVRERFEKEMLLSLGNRAQVFLWLKRSTRYLPFISKQLKKTGMPEDLKFLPIMESALRPHAGSARGAVGFWQLLPETARKYGLTVNEYIDQRRDLFLSTPAALNYLKALHDKFSSWSLALAAYNMGEEGLEAEILEQKTKDYYQLYLPLETQQFVLRLLAVKLIVSHPRTYGFKMAPEDYYRPLRFDTATLDCLQERPLRLVAEAAHTSFKAIKDLNPSLRGYYLQPGHHAVRVPPGRSIGLADRFQRLARDYGEQLRQRIYVVRSGDSLSTIAARFNIPVAALLIWNRIDLNKTLHPGDRLVIYPRARHSNSIEAGKETRPPSLEGSGERHPPEAE